METNCGSAFRVSAARVLAVVRTALAGVYSLTDFLAVETETGQISSTTQRREVGVCGCSDGQFLDDRERSSTTKGGPRPVYPFSMIPFMFLWYWVVRYHARPKFIRYPLPVGE
jgi:hypothetical protein